MKIRNMLLALALVIPMAFTGCATDRYGRSTGEYIDDKTISSRVEDALSDNAVYKFHDVKVQAYRGTVQLAGFVMTNDQKQKAEEIAESVPGVEEVVNNITVKRDE